MIPGMMPAMGKTGTDTTGPGTLLIIGGALLGIAATSGLSVLAWWLLDRPVSEMAGWVEAGATVAAVGAAIVAGFYAARAYGLEHQREVRWETDVRAAQASRVAAWPIQLLFEHASRLDSDGFEVEVPVRIKNAVVNLRNASDMPITQTRIVVTAVVIHPDGSVEVLNVVDVEHGSVEPETTEELIIPVSDPESLAVLMTDVDRELQIYLQFTDIVGRSWARRATNGELRDLGTSQERTLFIEPGRWWRRR